MLCNYKRNFIFFLEINRKQHIVMKNVTMHQFGLLHFRKTHFVRFHSSKEILNRIFGVFVIDNKSSDAIDDFIIKNKSFFLIKIANRVEDFDVVLQSNSFCVPLYKIPIGRFQLIGKPRRNKKYFQILINLDIIKK